MIDALAVACGALGGVAVGWLAGRLAWTVPRIFRARDHGIPAPFSAFSKEQCPACGRAGGSARFWIGAGCGACGPRGRSGDIPWMLAGAAGAITVLLSAPADAVPGLLLMTAFFLAMAAFDARSRLLPDVLSAATLGAGLAFSPVGDLLDRAIGVALGGAICILIMWMYRRDRGRASVFDGDVILLGAVGAWASWTGVPAAIIVAVWLGLLDALRQAAFRKRRWRSQGLVFPLALYLCLGSWLHLTGLLPAPLHDLITISIP